MKILFLHDFPSAQGTVLKNTVMDVANKYGRSLVAAGLCTELPHEKGLFSTERHRKRRLFNYLAQKNCKA
ncbi:MAG: hypothetical protein WCK54_18325 [Desulfuromonadales bacterium]